jgi:hypothetical protein
MSVEIGTEAAQFPEKEYINGIFLAMYLTRSLTFRRSLIVMEQNLMEPCDQSPIHPGHMSR